MNIPFHKPYITQDEINAVTDVLKKGWITMGPKTAEFEEAVRKYLGAKYAVAVNSCTAALHLALESIGLKEADEVIVPALTFTATAEVVCYFKAKPVFADVERDTHNISVGEIEKKINCRTKAIIPVHYGGQPCDMDEIMKLGKKHGIRVIEDAAHALPSWYRGRKVGTLADMTCFSFYATKPLATGEGGMVTTRNKKWADKLSIMRLHGMNRDAWKRYSRKGHWFYEISDAGFKYNMTDIQAALGIEQLKKLEFMFEKRKKIAEEYNKAFKQMDEIMTPFVHSDRKTSWHLYAIKLNLDALKIDRDKFIMETKKRGVDVSVHFIPLYRHPFYARNFEWRSRQFPHSEWVYKRIISLPIYPSMTKAETARVISVVKEVAKKNKR